MGGATNTDEITVEVPHEDVRRQAKRWAKHVTGIDRSERGAFALQGEFVDSLAHVPVGAILVTYGESTARSGNFTGHLWGVHRVCEDGTTEALDGGRSQDKGWVVSACDVIEAQLGERPELSDSEAALVAQLALLPAERRAVVIAAAG